MRMLRVSCGPGEQRAVAVAVRRDPGRELDRRQVEVWRARFQLLEQVQAARRDSHAALAVPQQHRDLPTAPRARAHGAALAVQVGVDPQALHHDLDASFDVRRRQRAEDHHLHGRPRDGRRGPLTRRSRRPHGRGRVRALAAALAPGRGARARRRPLVGPLDGQLADVEVGTAGAGAVEVAAVCTAVLRAGAWSIAGTVGLGARNFANSSARVGEGTIGREPREPRERGWQRRAELRLAAGVVVVVDGRLGPVGEEQPSGLGAGIVGTVGLSARNIASGGAGIVARVDGSTRAAEGTIGREPGEPREREWQRRAELRLAAGVVVVVDGRLGPVGEEQPSGRALAPEPGTLRSALTAAADLPQQRRSQSHDRQSASCSRSRRSRKNISSSIRSHSGTKDPQRS